MSEFVARRAEKVLSAPERLAAVFEAKREQIQTLLPSHLDFDRVRELVCIAYADPAQSLADCSPDSVFLAAREAVAIGLDPVTRSLGQAWLVPRWNKDRGRLEATFQIGYKGYYTLAHRSRRISRMASGVVYREELETFECDPGAGIIRHPWRPNVNRSPEEIVGAYCGVLLDGGDLPIVEILDRSQIEARRMRNPAEAKGKFSPWKTDYAAMARKCPARALFGSGMIPLSVQVAEAVHRDAVLDGEILEDAEAVVLNDTEQQAGSDVEPEGEGDEMPEEIYEGMVPDQEIER